MATMTNVIEYLLALEKPGGGKLVRYGVMLVTVPVFPPGMSLTFTITPYFNSYASIEYWHRFSPAIVPGTLLWDSRHSGMEICAGVCGAVATADGHNLWVEITESDPIITDVTNISGVNQFFETLDFFLLVDTEDDLKIVKEVIRKWGSIGKIEDQLDETNRLLRALIEATPGAVMPSPRPSIGGH